MHYAVLLTEGAQRDLEAIHDHIVLFDSQLKADRVLERLLELAEKLASSPERGSCPPELRALGMQEYRQLFFKPYRLIYRIFERQIIVYVIVDGRRDLQTLLARRLLTDDF